ncbi:MAG: response regulator [Calditrichaeota bacterium]|nr:MAG: response regulator [Calditrichota bacterium]
MQNRNSILIVDDEETICRLCHSSLVTEYTNVKWTTDPFDSLAMLKNEKFNILITDIKMPGMSGLDLIHKAKEIDPGIPIIIMTAYATVKTAVQAVQEGANNFIHKPFHIQEFKQIVQNLLEKERLRRDNLRLQSIVNLLQTSEKIATIHDPAKLHEIVLQAAIHETGATTGKIVHIDPATQKTTSIFNINNEQSDAVHSDGLSFESSTFSEIFHRYNDSTRLSVPLRSPNDEKWILELESKSKEGFSKADIDMTSILASQFAVALDNSTLINEIEELFLNTIKTLAFTLDEKDAYTHGHSQRVSLLAVEIGKRLKLDKMQLEQLAIAGSLHDIGKIGIPDNLLQKPGKLTAEETAILRTHPDKGAKILAPINRLKNVIDAVRSHHEFYDGNGYPQGLKGDEIPILGAIICVADALDSITSDRPYRKGRSVEAAYDIVNSCKGLQFHPDVVRATLKSPLKQLDAKR